MKELAQRIDAHLKRIYGLSSEAYFRGGNKVTVVINGRWNGSLSKIQAATYLAWLDAGNVGKHWEALK